MGSWHTELERDLIRRFGGTPKRQAGVDGEIEGRPVEVRAARKDDRYRLGKEVHEELMREGGSYIFHDDEHGTRRVPASEVDEDLPRGEWYEDRGYPHKFTTVDEVFEEPDPLSSTPNPFDRSGEPFDLSFSPDPFDDSRDSLL